MTEGPFTRYFCPLECGWHYDQGQPSPGEKLPQPLSQRPDESFQDLVARMAGETARTHLKQVEDALHEHLDTHTVIQAAAKAAEFRDERDRALMLANRESEMTVVVVMGDAGYGDGQYVAAVFASKQGAIDAGYNPYDMEEMEVKR